MIARIYIFLIVLLIASEQVLAQPIAITSACDFCIASQGISPLEMGRTGLRYDVRYLKMSKEYQNGSLVQNSSMQPEEFFTNQFTLSYQIAKDAALLAVVPVATKSGTAEMDAMPDMSMPTEHITNTGFGDIAIMGRYNFFTGHSYGETKMAAITAGVKLPTGSTSYRTASGRLAETDMQLGTGSLDWVVGTSLLSGTRKFAIATNATATITGKGANGHEFGNSLNYDATARYRVYTRMDDCTPSLFATAGLLGELRGHELQDGDMDPNSGGHIMYFAPGLQAFLSQSILLEARFQLPIVHALNGDQMGETYKIASGLQYMF